MARVCDAWRRPANGGRVSIAGVPPIAGHPIAGAEIKIKIKYFFLLLFIICSGVLCFWDDFFLFFLAVHYFQRCVILGYFLDQ